MGVNATLEETLALAAVQQPCMLSFGRIVPPEMSAVSLFCRCVSSHTSTYKPFVFVYLASSLPYYEHTGRYTQDQQHD